MSQTGQMKSLNATVVQKWGAEYTLCSSIEMNVEHHIISPRQQGTGTSQWYLNMKTWTWIFIVMYILYLWILVQVTWHCLHNCPLGIISFHYTNTHLHENHGIKFDNKASFTIQIYSWSYISTGSAWEKDGILALKSSKTSYTVLYGPMPYSQN